MVITGSREGEWQIVHIPDKPPVPPHLQPTVNVYASVIDPKNANTLVRKLNQVAPLENLRHVKRVRKQYLEGEKKNECISYALQGQQGKVQLAVILCLASENDCQLERMPNGVLGLISSYQLSTFVTKVSKYAASSKEEWEEQCKQWPTSYHPPTYNIDGIAGFSEEESQFVHNFMKFAVDLAKSGVGQVVNAAVIVDPSTKQLIASACDQVTQTSLETSCVGHPGGFISHSTAIGEENRVHWLLHNAASCLHPWQWTEQQLCTNSCHGWHPLRHAAVVAIEYSAARDRNLFPSCAPASDMFVQEDCLQPNSSGCASKRQKIQSTNVQSSTHLDFSANGTHSESDRPYLCTGYDAYLVWEPCTMCAMALLHQRIRRIFFALPNPNAGALGTVHRLHGERSLNHHYAVFRVLLPENVLGGDLSDGATTTTTTSTSSI